MKYMYASLGDGIAKPRNVSDGISRRLLVGRGRRLGICRFPNKLQATGNV